MSSKLASLNVRPIRRLFMVRIRVNSYLYFYVRECKIKAYFVFQSEILLHRLQGGNSLPRSSFPPGIGGFGVGLGGSSPSEFLKNLLTDKQIKQF